MHPLAAMGLQHWTTVNPCMLPAFNTIHCLQCVQWQYGDCHCILKWRVKFTMNFSTDEVLALLHAEHFSDVKFLVLFRNLSCGRNMQLVMKISSLIPLTFLPTLLARVHRSFPPVQPRPLHTWSHVAMMMVITWSCFWQINSLIAILKPQSNRPSYGNAAIGTLAVDGWAVTFGTLRRELVGPQPAQAPPRCAKCNSPPTNGQCTNFVLFDVALYTFGV